MFGVVKVAGLSAALAAALVIATEAPKPASNSARILTERLDLQTRKAPEPTAGCTSGAWPYGVETCPAGRAAETQPRRPIRTIGVDQREATASVEVRRQLSPIALR